MVQNLLRFFWAIAFLLSGFWGFFSLLDTSLVLVIYTPSPTEIMKFFCFIFICFLLRGSFIITNAELVN
ncbi:hypothetical protein F4810DRAFT_685330 [Camillea tinctor]|nr:hypothetical protein F4810DRAFT_685330 [Camillea tinctor]